MIHWQQEQLDQHAVMLAYGKWHMEVLRGRELALRAGQRLPKD
jgi:acetolactate synthase I/II/III large subunit